MVKENIQIVSLRFDKDKFAEIKERAEKLNVPISAYIKMKVFENETQ